MTGIRHTGWSFPKAPSIARSLQVTQCSRDALKRDKKNLNKDTFWEFMWNGVSLGPQWQQNPNLADVLLPPTHAITGWLPLGSL